MQLRCKFEFEILDKQMIDLLSDTITKPTAGMMKAMMNAPVGDDVFDEDPTVNALQDKAAEMFGMEAALYCASGTMTNQIAIKVHTNPGDEVICHHFAHIYNYEGGGMMFNSGVSPKLIGSSNGTFTASEAEFVINNPNDIHGARTRLIEVENTSNKGGGTCYDFSELKQIGKVARSHNLGYHLDGARLFNALVESEQTPLDYGNEFDSISICLSKGLGCPIGSLILGSKDFIHEAKFIRKRFGGAWRQAGFMAAAGIYALDNHIHRLTEDHEKARLLESALNQSSLVEKVNPVHTNVVIFTLKDINQTDDFIKTMMDRGVRMIGMGQGKLRMVTHMDVTLEDIQHVCKIIDELA